MTCPGIMRSDDPETGQTLAHTLHCPGCSPAAPVLTPEEREIIEKFRHYTKLRANHPERGRRGAHSGAPDSPDAAHGTRPDAETSRR